MKRGDKRYRYVVTFPETGSDVRDLRPGRMEVYTFIQERVVEGATKPTWLMLDEDGNRIQTSVNAMFASEAEALEAHRKNCEDNLKWLRTQREGIDKQIAWTEGEIKRMTDTAKSVVTTSP